MALTYDIKNDIRYKEGKEEGITEGIAIAIKRMLVANFSHQQIITVLNVPAEFVQKVADSLKK